MAIYPDYTDDEDLDECMETDCRCACHDDMYEDMGVRFEDGVRKDEDSDEPYIREGIFPLLKLPGELRDKVYGFTFLQEGNKRKSPYHRGTIHTALLSTCRQIHTEAGTLPLSLNTLNFSSALYTLYFLGFLLKPSQREQLTSIHIESAFYEYNTLSWHLLSMQLGQVGIAHLGLTIKGPCKKEAFLGHTCFINRFKEVLKSIKTFDIAIGSDNITKKVKDDIQEEMREGLIEGYKRPKKAKSKAKGKRSAASDSAEVKPFKKAKKSLTKNQKKCQTELVVSPKSTRLSIKDPRPEREEARLKMLAQYDQIKQYAKTIDTEIVSIRLGLARKAAEESDQPEFSWLCQDILATLDDRYGQIASARKDLPTFPKVARAAPPPLEAPSTPNSLDSWDSLDSSQLSV